MEAPIIYQVGKVAFSESSQIVVKLHSIPSLLPALLSIAAVVLLIALIGSPRKQD